MRQTTSLFLAAVCMSATGCQQIEKPTASIQPAPNYVELTQAQKSIVESGVRQSLKDPQSAQFGQMYASEDGETITVCGLVNSKNSFGGYVGMKPFMGALVNDKFVPIGIGGPETETYAVMKVCHDKGLPVGQA